MMANTIADWTESEMSRTAWTPPNLLCKPSARKNAGVVVRGVSVPLVDAAGTVTGPSLGLERRAFAEGAREGGASLARFLPA